MGKIESYVQIFKLDYCFTPLKNTLKMDYRNKCMTGNNKIHRRKHRDYTL